MHELVFHNDRIVPLGQARLSPGQAGLLSGWGLFTTLRLYDGKPFAFERHWQRLSRDAARIDLPFEFSAERVRAGLLELAHANRARDGAARLYFIYNKFGYWHGDEPMPQVDLLMYTADLPRREGKARLAIEEHGRYTAHPLTGTKVISWLQNVWALERARRRGFDDALLLNERGEVAECTAANVFCVRGGRVETPPLSSGCLAGVSREVLLEIGPEAGLPIAERPLALQELLSAEEVFITSTTREVQPVAQIEDHKLAEAPGPVTARLARAFSQYVARYLTQIA